MTDRIAMDDAEAEALGRSLGLELPGPFWNAPSPFDAHLRDIVGRYGLESLFNRAGPGRFHHALRPRGYDYDVDAVDPGGMETWRADYRSMADDRQMLAATIVWLYRGGKDNRWLRRVPCVWPAFEAITVMRNAGSLEDWARLVVLYPGW